ncbi:Transcriptional activator FeaR [Arthrobacter ulcerisalmonis]|uniref:Transcriptional activator FeaR n=1 Tax=Arthrobacter ulcerisalmonis TaxID=2483813 RepID=A0A3P5XF09_9MICC|nr:helix-turn-helix domain-containing protein [Arthrobacter ulcerisalmonis]VDC29955.1 Transcriptional activator FeaR [Arthrobacter ulcerisalmonis]
MSNSVVAHHPRLADGAVLAPRDRFDAWHQAVSSSFVPLDARPPDIDTFHGDLISQSLGDVLVSEVSGTAMQVSRTRSSIRQNDPGVVKLGLQLRGYCVVAQDGREAALTPGDFAIYDTTRPYDLYFDDSYRMLVLMLPQESLSLGRGQLARITASRISGRHGVGALTSSLLTTLDHQLTQQGADLGFEATDAIVQLISATFRQVLEGGAPAPSPREVILLQVKQYIQDRLGEYTLSVAEIAAANHVPVRYLQKIFADSGESVSHWIRQQRLNHCRQELADPLLVTRPISTVGLRWGFSDAASFARTFKSVYGYTPGEFRYSYNPQLSGSKESLSLTAGLQPVSESQPCSVPTS